MATKTKKGKPPTKTATKSKGKSLGKPALKDAGAAGSVKAMKKAVKRGGSGGGGQFLYRIPQDGRTVRFMHEPHEWLKFFEHYDETKEDNRYQPCTEDCDGCDRNLSRSKRWVANAIDVEEGKVIPQVLPATLAQNLMKKFDKFGTIMDRDYELVKDGQMTDTTYDALYDGPQKMNTKRFEMLDLEAIVLSQIDSGDDEDDDEEDDDEAPAKSKSKGKKSKAKIIDSGNDDDDDEDDAPAHKKAKGKTKAAPKSVAKKPPAKKGLAKKPVKTLGKKK